ncbi:MAG TPA: ATP-dependent protease LonB [Candidatus Nanoarchaeia archaeon]|nr:ATP-dependent protease LonB [Candidatus Nanoarchaeia archaeon]
MTEFKSTEELVVSKQIIEQVIGQEHAVQIMKKAANQRRHVLLIGDPGTGKSMLGLALAEMLPKSALTDIIAFPNPNDENTPLIKEVPAGQGRTMMRRAQLQGSKLFKNQNIILLILVIASTLLPYYFWRTGSISDIIYAASMIASILFIVGFLMFLNLGARTLGSRLEVPKLVVDNSEKKIAPFFDATGAHAGALLGDVLHDPFQSGGLGTPANQRVVAGMIHKAHHGVLFIDEIATLHPRTQQELLSALQEKQFPITGQSERSAGAMVRTEPVPCDFIMVAAGNTETLKRMHPALRSRIRGYGYEVYMNDTIIDTPENRMKIAYFVAQEVKKDGKIPHFSKEAVDAVVEEARRRANRKGHLTLHLRSLGGIVRAAGDLAREQNAPLVERDHFERAKKPARPLEHQMADRYIERKKEYEVIVIEGNRIGRVNGLAVIGSTATSSGVIQPIESEVTPGGKTAQITATGKLGIIAKEAILNVRAIIMKHFGEDIKQKHDIFVQFLQTYEGVEGDSASIAVATAIISAFKQIPVRQDTAMTGSLSVRGDVLPVGGVSSKVEAAIEAGLKRIIVPRSNLQDIVLNGKKLKGIEILPVDRIEQVLKEALVWQGHKKTLKMLNIE